MKNPDGQDPWNAREDSRIWSYEVEMGDRLRANDLVGGLPNDERRLAWRLLDVLATHAIQAVLTLGTLALLAILLEWMFTS